MRKCGRVRRLGYVMIVACLFIGACATRQMTGSSQAQLSVAPSVAFQQIGVDKVREQVADTVANTRRLGTYLVRGAASNVVVSPLSAMLLLSMVRAGAEGQTATEMDAVLGRNDFSAFAALTGQLEGVGGDPGQVDSDNPPNPPVFNEAAGVFVDRSLPVGASYLDILARYFDTGVYPIDFASGAAHAAINQWLAVNSGEVIDSAPTAYQPDTRMSLLSTVFLAAAWQQPFSPGSSGDALFARGDGSTVQTTFMNSTRSARYVATQSYQSVELPYGAGIAMQVVVPAGPLSSLINPNVLASVTSQLRSARPDTVAIAIPRWTVKSSIDMRPILGALGIRRLFTESADLSKINPSLTVSAVAQDAAIVVGEKGTVVAAATQADMTPTMGSPSLRSIRADRPFFYQIVDTATGTPLFLGVVADPTTK